MTIIKDKIISLLIQLNHGLVDRDATLKSTLLSILAGENILLIGPPGTAKSLIARRITQSFTHEPQASTIPYFEYLLTKFSTPEEIFGPLSISELKQDRFKRNTAGYLPSVKIAFLDEIFKASSSILNALLTIMNERVYHNGTNAVKVPLRALIAASNELPTGQEELNALYDRFLVRSFVDYVGEGKLQYLFELNEDKDIEGPLTHDDLKQLDDSISSIKIPDNIKQAVQDIWHEHKEAFKEDRREELSDRRLIKIIKLLRVSAATNGRNEVDLSDVLLLKNCLWNHPDNIATVQKLIIKVLRNYSSSVPLSEQDTPTVSATKVAPKRRVKGVIKGYTGSGTIDDPLLISNTDELIGLLRPDIGLKGYYFQQTKDIDCSSMSSWTEIPFQGHYNGNSFSIKGTSTDMTLFDDVQPKSSITALVLIDYSLANNIEGSEITYCISDGKITRRDAIKSKIHSCSTTSSLVGGNVEDCEITQCQTKSILIDDSFNSDNYAKNSTITDCMIELDNFSAAISYKKGGIVVNAFNSKIKRCIVTGTLEIQRQFFGFFPYIRSSAQLNTQSSTHTDNFNFFGITSSLKSGEITECILGPITSAGEVAIKGITSNSFDCKLINNASVDSIKIHNRVNNSDDIDGREIANSQFNQYFFEHTLNWDFNTVWQWDGSSNLPRLRKVVIDADKSHSQADESEINSVDLLMHQIKANIWL
ncbi:AAA family ATPase [Shewanella sp. HL-SH5]|uniref:AAA family ATPase n=1 Tax=Shewanella sp. HL-SH5 TaxID=3436241 RepID=UPI003EB937E2